MLSLYKEVSLFLLVGCGFVGIEGTIEDTLEFVPLLLERIVFLACVTHVEYHTVGRCHVPVWQREWWVGDEEIGIKWEANVCEDTKS